MSQAPAVALVNAWLNALNTHDVDRIIAFSAPSIEIIGPRGSAYGQDVLRDWISRAGLSLNTQRVFARDGVVVVAQQGIWRSTDTGEVMGKADVASCFRVVNNLIVQVARYDDLDTALEFGGLTYTDEIVSS